MHLNGDQIRVVVVSPRKGGGFDVYEKAIRPKDRFFKRIVDREEPDLIGCMIREVFPGHAMKIADDSTPEQRALISKWPRWKLTGSDEIFWGNAVIYAIQKSEPVTSTLSVEQVREALAEVI